MNAENVTNFDSFGVEYIKKKKIGNPLKIKILK